MTLKSVSIIKARDQSFGSVFRRPGKRGIFLRVKPVNYILNSTLIVDKINSGAVLVVNLTMATLHFINGDDETVSVNANLEIS